jgi:hypothetical protein
MERTEKEMDPVYTYLTAIGSSSRLPLTAMIKNADTNHLCLNCGAKLQSDMPLCPQCGTLFTSGDTTRIPDLPIKYRSPVVYPIGQAIASQQHLVALEIDDTTLVLPDREALTVGRASGLPGDVVPEVDLNDVVSAEHYGVSRCHLRLNWNGNLLYVMDLGSTNGLRCECGGKLRIDEGRGHP